MFNIQVQTLQKQVNIYSEIQGKIISTSNYIQQEVKVCLDNH